MLSSPTTQTTVRDTQELVDNLPPSAQKIYWTLQQHKMLNSKELIQKTKYSPRAVRYALRRLQNDQLVIQITNMRDTRMRYYALYKLNPGSYGMFG